jgi:2-haloacid dehalogenase
MAEPVPVQAVVFDLGNVFVQWDRDLLYRSVIADPAERRRFLDEVLTIDVNLRLDAGERFDEVLSEVAAAYPDEHDLIWMFKTRWAESLGNVDTAMVDLLAALRGSVPVYALTNFSAETFPLARQRFDWLGWFDDCVVSGVEGLTKPDPAIYELVTSRFGLDPDRVWFTDDSVPNIDGARRAGWMAEVFTDAASAVRQLAALGLDLGSLGSAD